MLRGPSLPLAATAMIGACGLLVSALAAPAVEGGGKQGLNPAAIVMFFAFVLGTLYITYRAAQGSMRDLGIPLLSQHDALNDAVMVAMIYLELRDRKVRGVRIRRERAGQGPPPPTGG